MHTEALKQKLCYLRELIYHIDKDISFTKYFDNAQKTFAVKYFVLLI